MKSFRRYFARIICAVARFVWLVDAVGVVHVHRLPTVGSASTDHTARDILKPSGLPFTDTGTATLGDRQVP